jgi:hypothetical protein
MVQFDNVHLFTSWDSCLRHMLTREEVQAQDPGTSTLIRSTRNVALALLGLYLNCVSCPDVLRKGLDPTLLFIPLFRFHFSDPFSV